MGGGRETIILQVMALFKENFGGGGGGGEGGGLSI